MYTYILYMYGHFQQQINNILNKHIQNSKTFDFEGLDLEVYIDMMMLVVVHSNIFLHLMNMGTVAYFEFTHAPYCRWKYSLAQKSTAENSPQ